MLKRFYSKRSGFTLVEIIVAFAVFAIMASMIAQILDLSISARNANNQYARELARQEKILTVVQKDGSLYKVPDDPAKEVKYNIAFINKDGTPLTPLSLGYQAMAVDPEAENQKEGINYFISPVNYDSKNSGGEGGSGSPEGSAASDGMSQASRMDTRITGTSGLSKITVFSVMEDTNDYPVGSEFYLDREKGQTRYFIEVAASTKNDESKNVFQVEDIPYAQYRLYFYFPDELDADKSDKKYKDEDGQEYTRNVPKKMKVLKTGLINVHLEDALASGLNDSNTSPGMETSSKNYYTVETFPTNSDENDDDTDADSNSINNTVRIGTPFSETDGRGVKFEASKFTRFYVDFQGDPKLTTASFGHNGEVKDDGSVVYKACPQYESEYDDKGLPTYKENDDGLYHPNIYGANMFSIKYTDGSETPDE